jgi:hypothetical protein
MTRQGLANPLASIGRQLTGVKVPHVRKSTIPCRIGNVLKDSCATP